ncbi:MAG: hypothetical protein IKE43_10575 [Coriobacteriales bacterium]|nr:hypothetical protein [Coriobacteriales bacterium]
MTILEVIETMQDKDIARYLESDSRRDKVVALAALWDNMFDAHLFVDELNDMTSDQSPAWFGATIGNIATDLLDRIKVEN